MYSAFRDMDGTGLHRVRQRRKGDLGPNLVALHHFTIRSKGHLRSNIAFDMGGENMVSRKPDQGWGKGVSQE